MSKRSGYSVRITAFIEASPTDMEAMKTAIHNIDTVCDMMRVSGFLAVKHETRFMLSKDIGVTPLVPQPGPAPSPLDIPTALRRA